MTITGYVVYIFSHEIELSLIVVSSLPMQPMQVEENLA